MNPDIVILTEAVRIEGLAQRALLDGEPSSAGFLAAAALYRASWEAAAPDAFGRLVGLIKAAVIAGDAAEAATYVIGQIADERDSPVAAYAHAVASIVQGDDDTASRSAREMARGGEAFAAPAAALEALASCSRPAYRRAIATIVADFEGRVAHLTGVPIADTAVMLERLASRRGMDVRPVSRVMPG